MELTTPPQADGVSTE